MDSTNLSNGYFWLSMPIHAKHHHLYPPPTLWAQHERGWDLSLVPLYQSNNKMSHGQPSLEIHPHLIVENFFLEKLSTKPLVQVLMTFWSILNINTNMLLMPSYIIQQAKYPLGNGFHPFFKKVTYPFSTLLFIYPHFFSFFSPPFPLCDEICYHLPCNLRPHGTWKINDHATPQHSQGLGPKYPPSFEWCLYITQQYLMHVGWLAPSSGT